MENKNDSTRLCDFFSDNLAETDFQKAHCLSEIACAITAARVGLQMTQTEFAKYMNVTQGMVSKWENGDYNFTVEKLVDIFSKLNYDLDIHISPRSPKRNNVVDMFPNKETRDVL